MKINITQFLGIKEGEELKFSLLILNTFAMGLYLSLYYAPALSEFVQKVIKPFGNEYMPLAYIASGVVGYITSIIYAGIQKRSSLQPLFVGTMLFLVILTIGLRLLGEVINDKWIGFLLYVCAAPIIALTGMVSGGLSLRLLDLQQGKRLLGLISAGGTVASVVGYIIGPIIRKSLANSLDIFYFAGAGPLFAIAVLFLIFKYFPEQMARSVKKKAKAKGDFFGIFKDKYFRLIIIVASISTIVVYFTSFSYLATIKNQPQINQMPDGSDLDMFIAYFLGATRLLEFLLSFWSSRIFSKYGMKFALNFLPAISLIVIGLAAITGSISGESSLFFFMFVILNRFTERTLRKPIEDPAFRILYQPVPDNQKLAVQTKIDGAVKQLAMGLSGVLLIILTFAVRDSSGVFDIELFQWFFLPVVAAWLYYSLKLYDEYKIKLKIILHEKNEGAKLNTQEQVFGTDLLIEQIQNKSAKTEFCTAVLAQTNSELLNKFIAELLYSGSEQTRFFVLKHINFTFFTNRKNELLHVVNNSKDEFVIQLAKKWIEYIEYKQPVQLTNAQVKHLCLHESTQNEALILNYILKNPSENLNLILLLLKSDNDNLKRAAIKIAGQIPHETLTNELISLLDADVYYHIAAQSLIQYGDSILEELEIFFDKENRPEILLRIVEIYARMRTTKALSFLVYHINYPDSNIRQGIIEALYSFNYQAKEKEKVFVRQLIEDCIEHILWITAASLDLEKEKSTLRLLQSLDDERIEDFGNLFKLLSFIFEPSTINLIRVNFTGDNNIFALEIIENFISPDVKEIIQPLFEGIPAAQLLNKMSVVFPQHRLSFTNRLKDIINKNYNNVNLITKVRAMELLAKIEKNKLSYETISCLYHPNELMFIPAAKIMKNNTEEADKYLSRLPNEKLILIKNLGKGAEYEDFFIANKIKAISRIPMFFSANEEILYKLAQLFVPVNMQPNSSYRIKQLKPEVFLIIQGKIQTLENNILAETYGKHSLLIQGMNLKNSCTNFETLVETKLLVAERIKFLNMIVDNLQLTKLFL